MSAVNLPTKEQCEIWSSTQVANFLSQTGMGECSDRVRMMKIDGRWLLNLSERDLSRFNVMHRPQLQKMVQDIKNNDGGIMNRLKRFQNEQAASLRKTGKSTWDRLKNKPPPKVPIRDYNQDERADADQWSGSEFDSDTYEDPLENHDDNYEPPPSGEVMTKRLFAPPTHSFPKGEYIDTHHGRLKLPPRKPQTGLKPQVSAKPAKDEEDDEDYIDPEGEDDNYIEPSEKTEPEPSSVNRGAKPKERCASVMSGEAQRVHSPDLYEVPDMKENTAQASGSSSLLRAPVHSSPPTASPRQVAKKPPPSPEVEHEDEYEVCDPDESKMTEWQTGCRQDESALHQFKRPIPHPRELKKPNPLLKPKNVKPDSEVRPMAMKRNIQNVTTTALSLPSRSPLPRQVSTFKGPMDASQQPPQTGSSAAEQAGVYKKAWYAGNCNRKTAEEALTRTKQDGSFLLRKSSGQDAQQPFTLVVFYKSKVYNIPVRFIQSSHQYALGKEKKGEERFSTVGHIIENHQRNVLVLIDSQNNTKDSTKLLHAVQL